MIRPVRKTELLLVLAMINAGCAQMSGTYVAGDVSAAVDWPTPVIDNSLAPIPSEPTLLPQAVMPAEKQVTPRTRPACYLAAPLCRPTAYCRAPLVSLVPTGCCQSPN